MRRVPPLANPGPDAALPYRNGASGSYPGSTISAEFFNAVAAEITAVIEDAGLTPEQNTLTQLRDAIAIKIAGGGVVDSSTFCVVNSGPSASPPGSPATGDEVLVAFSASGGFAGQDGKLARRTASAWVFSDVRPGRVFRIAETDSYFQRTSSGWAAFTVPVALVAGLQSALDGKVAKAGDTMSGALRMQNDRHIHIQNAANSASWGAGLAIGKQPDNGAFFDNHEGNLSFRRAGFAETLRLRQDGVVDVLSGAQTIMGNSPYLALRRNADNQSNQIFGQRANGSNMWLMELGNWATSQFAVSRFDTGGNYLGSPFCINANGAWGMNGDFGAAEKVLTSNDVGGVPSWTNIDQLSKLLQSLISTSDWYGDLTNGMTAAATAPTTEGTAVCSLSITPRRANSRLRIRFTATVGHNGGAYPAVRILHNGAHALTVCQTIEYAPWFGIMNAEVEVPSGWIGSRGIEVRIGNLGGGGNIKLNGSSTTHLVGSKAILIVDEIM